MNRFNFILKVFKDTKKVVFNNYINTTNQRSSYNIFNNKSGLYNNNNNKNNRFYTSFSQQNNYKNQYQHRDQQEQKQYKREHNESKDKLKKYKLGVLLSPTLLFSNTSLPETNNPVVIDTSDINVEYKTNSSAETTSNVDSNSILIANNTHMSPDISSTSNETSVTLENDEDFDKMKVDENDDTVELKQLNNNNNNSSNFVDEANEESINNNNNNNFEPFHFHTGVCVIPHPNKRHKGGEDSYFISNDNKVLGVADGVGGWGDVGIDPSEYSRKLMEGSKLASDSAAITRDPLCIMEQGYIYSQDVKGSSTCCVVVVDGNNLLSANLGDSGFLVIRNSEIIFRTREQQHAFNMPYQLGTQSIDRPIHSITSVFEVEKGDLVVMGTDGVFDNLFDDEILEIGEKNDEPYAIAKKIALKAFEVGCSTTTQTPFSKNANLNGYIYTGGKLDDITVIVGIVAEGIPQPFVSELLPLDDIKSDEY